MENPDKAQPITLTLPAGTVVPDSLKDPDKLAALFTTINKGKIREKAVLAAITALRKKYKPEYEALVSAEMKKLGIS